MDDVASGISLIDVFSSVPQLAEPMKPATTIVLALVAVGLAIYLFTRPKTETTTSSIPVHVTQTPYWEDELPPNMKLLSPDRRPKFNVVCERVMTTAQNTLAFHITEQHGFAADGVRIRFWYQELDEDTGEWVPKGSKVDHVARKRLEFNGTLVEQTALLDIEYQELKIDLAATTSENWKAEVVQWARVMEPAE